MNARAKDLLKEALSLPLDERAELAAELLASMDGSPEADVEGAWGLEIEQRARRALSGETAGVPWEEVRADALQKLGQR